MSIRVTVGIICLNQEKTISETIQHLLSQDFRDFEILIVDGNSKDNTRKKVQTIKKNSKIPITLLNEKNFGGRGRAFARNLIVDKAKGKYVAFTDGDCVVPKTWLKEIYKIMESKYGKAKNIAGSGGPRLIYTDDPFMARSINAFLTSGSGSGNNPAYVSKNISYIESIANYNAIYKREVLLKYMYDNEFKGGEDLEMNYRMRNDGLKFIYHNIGIIHHEDANYFVFVKQMGHYGDMMAQATLRHKRVMRWYSIPPVLLVLYILFGGMASCVLNSFFGMNIFLFYKILFVPYILFVLYSTMTNIVSKGFEGFMTILLMPTQHIMYGLGFIKRLLWQG